MKRYFSAFVALFALLWLSACSDDVDSTPSSTSSTGGTGGVGVTDGGAGGTGGTGGSGAAGTGGDVGTGGSGGDPAPTEVKIVVASPDNLQFMSFWVALGANLFSDEGLDVEIVAPPGPGNAGNFFLMNDANVAVLPPPLYLPLIEQQQPIVVFGNLLTNDQINVAIRETVRQQIGISLTAPLAERVEALRGLRVGVAPGPVTRLRALLEAFGMDADQDITMVTIQGPMQNAAFAAGDVDVLYAHTPFLEEALLNQGAVVLVNQSSGEVPELAGRQIHSLIAKSAFADANPEVLLAVTRAVYHAQQLIHADPAAVPGALLNAIPTLDAALVDVIAPLYGPAVPQSPVVWEAGIIRALELYPNHQPTPDLSGLDINDYLAPQFAEQVVAEGS